MDALRLLFQPITPPFLKTQQDFFSGDPFPPGGQMSGSNPFIFIQKT